MNDLISRKHLLSLYDGLEGKGLRIPIDTLILNIEDEPTAYDPDKVVEALDNYGMWKEFMTYALTHREAKIIGKAIEIVKKGAEE